MPYTGANHEAWQDRMELAKGMTSEQLAKDLYGDEAATSVGALKNTIAKIHKPYEREEALRSRLETLHVDLRGQRGQTSKKVK